ncbi:hypothetical protein B1C78_15200 [Thioalkalivibrio denitrificans]|uniref:DUF4412 domain-containing protein n=1 Tax=Thioalkalivibrio denitrificans TaxID=108003 RepID=A0A1V3NBB8_9GAMM|nr:hypothetical protein [Thioalkalivibrio denitrificans]OOG22321.1 hypothetical protein B1C78_15200 [Thioalkalivibrio denitrificans]
MRTTTATLVLICLLALSFAGAVQADTRLVYETPDGELTLEYRDDDHMRFRMPDGGFMLVTGGEGYALSRDEGGWTAVSAEQIRAMVRTGGGSGEQVRLTALGRHETVAGIRGERYRVEVGDDWSNEWRDDGEVVLSSDDRVRVSGRAMRRMAELFGDMDDMAAFSEATGVDVNRVGLLETEEMRLVSVNTDRLSDQTFQMPPNVRHQELPVTTQAPAQPREQEQSGSGGWLGRQAEGARDEAKRETERETQREIRDGVRDAVRGVFGR